MATEKRLIDADALQRRICGAKCGCEYEDCGCEGDCIFDCFISNAPTVDAVEVVHGHWIDLGRNYYTVVSQCSECGAKYDFRSLYCPNCGAKMDGGKDDGKAD